MLGVRADWGLYVKFTGSGEEIAFKADTMMDTMSVIKIPLLATLFRACDRGALDLAQTYTLETRYKRFGTGVLQAMDDGMVFSLRDAATLMIIDSDNTATDYCYDAVGGPDAVNETMRELGLADIDVMGDGFDWFSALAASIDPALGELSPAALFRAGYPEDARVAHKTGDFNPFIANDVGVIESRAAAPIIISVLVAGHRGLWENLEDTIARMAEKIWEYGVYAG